MTEKILKNNQAVVAGEIISDFEFSHEVFGEGFYFVKLKVSRLSHSSDIIPLLVSERLIDVSESHIGQFLEARGQFRSYNKQESDKNRVVLFLFAKEIEMIDSAENRNPNEIFLDGYICKEPVYRTTPLGREIADVLLAVNRAYGKSDYIPCICWGRNARYAGNLTVGSRIQLRGRIQSREYQKRIGEGKVVDKIAYEVSASQMEYIEEEE
jgi:single-stranded DNA-binding protein